MHEAAIGPRTGRDGGGAVRHVHIRDGMAPGTSVVTRFDPADVADLICSGSLDHPRVVRGTWAPSGLSESIPNEEDVR